MPKQLLPSAVVVHVHPRGWMDEDGMKLWIRKVWCARPGGLMKRKSVIVFDSFRAHLVPGVEGKLREENTDICVIPGGLTSQLQPLDVCLNKPFKQGMRMKWTEWLMDKTNHDFTSSGLLKKPSISFMCAWIKEVWKGLRPDMIVKSFKNYSINLVMQLMELKTITFIRMILTKVKIHFLTLMRVVMHLLMLMMPRSV